MFNINNADGAEKTLANLADDSRILAAAIYNKDGKLWARFPKKAAVTNFPDAPTATESHVFENGSLRLFRPIHDPHKYRFQCIRASASTSASSSGF